MTRYFTKVQSNVGNLKFAVNAHVLYRKMHNSCCMWKLKLVEKQEEVQVKLVSVIFHCNV